MEVSEIKEYFVLEPEVLLDALGIDYRNKGGYCEIICPFHADNHFGSAKIKDGRFHCFACGESADCFKLVMYVNKVSFPAAVNFVAKAYEIPSFTFNPEEAKKDEYFTFRLKQKELDALGISSTISMKAVFDASKERYKSCILKRAQQKKLEYEKIVRKFGSRTADGAIAVYDLLDGKVSAELYNKIRTEAEERISIVNSIIERFKED